MKLINDLFRKGANQSPNISEADEDVLLIRKAIKYAGYGKIGLYVITGNFLALAWDVSISQVNKMIDKMYDNVRSFNFDPYMDIIVNDYEAFRSGASTDEGSLLFKEQFPDGYIADQKHKKGGKRNYQYNWTDFITVSDKMIALSKMYQPKYVNVSSRTSRIKLYFEHRFIEKALLRLSMANMTEEELINSRTIFEAFLLISPGPF